jgi:hypothetical protein
MNTPTKKTAPGFPTKGCGIRGAKHERHLRKGRSENGRTKTKTCQAKWMERAVCKNSRSYKYPEYATTMTAIDRKAGRVKTLDYHGLGRGSMRRLNS